MPCIHLAQQASQDGRARLDAAESKGDYKGCHVNLSRECRRLAEVDFPIAAVSAHSAREKSIRHGHPSTLHIWWARRPLGACRAVLMSLLLPDPCDPLCPREFKAKAISLIGR